MAHTLPIHHINTEKLARDIREAGRNAHTEEDVKMRLEPLLRQAFKTTGIDVDIVEYEKATAVSAKRMDAVYGYVIIEYKAPGKLENATTLQNVKLQIQRYLEEQSRRQGNASEAFLEKAVGVVLDGRQIMFVRFSRRARILTTPVPIESEQADLFPEVTPRRGFQFQGPFPITPGSLASLLIYVRSAGRRPLTAPDLAKVFGPEHEISRLLVSELYSAAMRGQRRSTFPRVAAFYEEWNRIFGVVYGEKLEKAEKAAEETARLYNLPSGIRLKTLLFAIHTFYAFLMKLIAIELLALQKQFNVASFVENLAQENNRALQEYLARLESGAGFVEMGITNFLEADFFSWYLDIWSARMAGGLRSIIRALADFEPATPVLEPDWTRDLLQKLYELLVPKILRHGLGEYYTPDWLAEYLVDKTDYSGAPECRFLDPACGSGTFLVQAIHRAARFAGEQPKVRVAEVGRTILNNIVGFDLNPLAVLAARTNYLIAFAPFLPYVRPVSLPVYLCDSILPPDCEPDAAADLFNKDVVVFRTNEHDYVFPVSMKNKERIDRFTGAVMMGLRGKMDADQFQRLLAKDLPLPDKETGRLLDIYRRIKQLDDEKRDGIWAHYIKNAFAPVYVGQFDYVIGNPPWIRWGYLSDEYRRLTLRLWHAYGLFSLTGHETRLGAGEKDFSMLFTYACADRYLKTGGTLGFVITQEVFKSKGAGEGFRRFQLGEQGAPLKVLSMEDMVQLQPFQAANKTTIFTMQKGSPTRYPVPTVEWKRNPGIGKIPPEWPLAKVLENTERHALKAVPVDPAKPVSSWQTASLTDLKLSEKLKGPNPYLARLGARVEPYGVFWLNLKEVRPDGLLVVENQHDRGKRDIPKVLNAIEPDLVYPAVSGGDLVKFGIKSSFFVLISQDPEKRSPYPEEWMLDHVPQTYAYLKQFEKVLRSRGSNIVRQFAERTEFYAMYGIGEYTFARHRVVWKRMAAKMEATVIGALKTPFGTKPIVATDTTSLITAASAGEAHYLCAILNSARVDDYISSFSSGGRGFGAPSVVQTLAIPCYQERRSLHQRLSVLSQDAHAAVQRGQNLDKIQTAINAAADALWNIKP